MRPRWRAGGHVSSENFGVPRFLRLHNWVRHAKCTWSSYSMAWFCICSVPNMPVFFRRACPSRRTFGENRPSNARIFVILPVYLWCWARSRALLSCLANRSLNHKNTTKSLKPEFCLSNVLLSKKRPSFYKNEPVWRIGNTVFGRNDQITFWRSGRKKKTILFTENSAYLMTNRDSSKLLQNYNKIGHSVLIGQSDPKNLGFHSPKTSINPV